MGGGWLICVCVHISLLVGEGAIKAPKRDPPPNKTDTCSKSNRNRLPGCVSRGRRASFSMKPFKS